MVFQPFTDTACLEPRGAGLQVIFLALTCCRLLVVFSFATSTDLRHTWLSP